MGRTDDIMDYSFAEHEKRFVLAEIIKSSRLDVETLAMFVRDNRIEPDWWNMQLPPRRNMNQCVEAADRMGIASSLKRRSSNDYTEHSSKRTATASRPGYPPPVPVQPNYPYTHQPPAPPHGAVLPHPGMSDYRQRHPAMSVADSKPDAPVTRKRGRPSRADKAKRDLQPILPRPLAPQVTRPPRFSPSSHISDVPPSFSNGLAPLAPKRNTLPALLSPVVTAARPITPPEAYVSAKGTLSSPRPPKSGTLSPLRGDGPRPRSAHENGTAKQSGHPGSPPRKRLLVE